MIKGGILADELEMEIEASCPNAGGKARSNERKTVVIFAISFKQKQRNSQGLGCVAVPTTGI
jgi:hypothetical protein